MIDNKSTIERAIELAKSGTCGSVEEIRRKLAAEGYEDASNHLAGPTLKKQINGLLTSRR